MKRALLLAEKPSVTRDIEAVYIKNRNKIDYEIDFDAFAGHVCELSEPD